MYAYGNTEQLTVLNGLQTVARAVRHVNGLYVGVLHWERVARLTIDQFLNNATGKGNGQK